MSQFMTWSDDYSVHFDEIDEQHKRLFDLINAVYDELLKRSGKLNELLQELIDYTVYHFSLEEEMMQKAKYPKLEAHKQHHAELIAQVQKFEQRIRDGARSVEMELLYFLEKWLVNHILNEDRHYTPFIDKNIHKIGWWKRLFG